MTLIRISPMIYPEFPIVSTHVTASEANIANSAENVASIGYFPVTGEVTKVAIAVGSVGTGNCDISLETISSGDATGTLVSAGAVASAVAYTGLSDRVLVGTLTTPYDCTGGGRVAAVTKQNSSANLNVNGWSTSRLTSGGYNKEDVGSGYVNGNRSPSASFLIDNVWFAIGGGFVPSPTAQNFSSWHKDSTPDERGVYFSVPFSCKITAIFAFLENDIDSAAAITLYDTDGTSVLQAAVLDTAERNTTTTGPGKYSIPETSLSKNVFYRIALTPAVTSGNNFRLQYYNCGTAEGADSMIINWHGTSRTDLAGTWDTTDETIVPRIGIEISQIDDGTGSGGGGGTKLAGYGGGMIG